jgi:hypothetical protein
VGPMPMGLRGGQSLIKVLHSPPRPIGIITPKSPREREKMTIFTSTENVNKAINDVI